MKLAIKFVSIVTIVFNSGLLFSQSSTYVDDQGVFRWVNNKSEIRLFGVNYTLPFAHGFRAINYIGKDHKKAIDKDVYHIARMGLDAFRIHIWDSEISDSLGNLVQSKQLDLLDYALFKMKERGIKTIVTPFKVGGNGYPEKNQPVPGFSANLLKPQTYFGKEILKKQERYFTQLLNHVNPYTGLPYKNDPDIIALEINNEPQHDNAEIATKYINGMVEVIRKTGFENPIFYNVSERSEFADAFCKANIQGCTFQWYPTGLVYNKTLKGNYLPNVDSYNIPFKDNENFKNKARIIYEFDPADTNQSYLYPAMARSFREAKFQFATQFAYEPLDLAYANTEYQTHYLNLIHTPSKSVSLMIASEVFHEMRNGQSFGRYPKNTTFNHTKLDSGNDLAVYNSNDKFYYTNSTIYKPKNEKQLKHIVGVGSSHVVNYSGTGAYFLDKVEDGIWRLEVMPDFLWVNDPFEKASLNKTVSIIEGNKQKMKIDLLDLGSEFSISPLDINNKFSGEAYKNEFLIAPGTYLLHKEVIPKKFDYNQRIGAIKLTEFVGPDRQIKDTYLVHSPLKEIEPNQDLTVKAKVVAPSEILKVEVVLSKGYQKTSNYAMIKSGTFSYTVEIPKEKINNNSFNYYITVTTTKGQKTFPSNVEGSPADWDFISKEQYQTEIVSKEPIVVLFDAADGFENTIWPSQWNAVKYKTNLMSSKFASMKTLKISIQDLNTRIPDMTFKMLVGNKVKRWNPIVEKTNKFVIVGTSGTKKSQKVQIAFQLRNGVVFGKTIKLSSSKYPIEINFQDLKRVSQVLLPRPYPVFQPYWFKPDNDEAFDAKEIEAIQISIGPGIEKEQQLENQQITIDKIFLK
ncbi:cellulase family glycosylhydrolase [Seonamhaeicola sp. MEBiC1930]|uniref:hypothetical protein n=1 Tax=Seonamhaeicola sp. MEBiC01930 TaxID=2976768 RepID=UPI003246A935